MIEKNSNIKHDSKKTITAILLAVIVLLLICILVKSFIKNDNDTTINNNSITTSPEVQSPTKEPSGTDNHNATTGLPTDIIGTITPGASVSITTPGATPNAFTEESFPTRKDSNGVYSKYAYMIDLETHKVVYEKNADLAMYPASMTKIMTV